MKHLLTIIFTIISTTLFAYNATQATDSLLSLLKASQFSQQKVQLYRHLADISFDKPGYRMYLWKMYQEASKNNDKKKMLEALNDIVIEEARANRRDSVIKYTEYVKQIATSQEAKPLLSFYRMRLFDSLCYSGKKDEGIKGELSFLDISKDDTNDNYKKASSAYIMGTSFYMSSEYKKAAPYLEEAIKYTESFPEKEKLIYQTFINWRLCFTYVRIGKHMEAIKIMEDLINASEQQYRRDYQKQRPFYKIELFMIQYYSFIFTNTPYLTIEQENYYWNKVKQIGKMLNNDMDKYSYYLCLNNYYSNNHTKIDIPKAIAANDSLIRIAKKLAPQNLPGLYNGISALYESIGEYRNALEYQKKSRHYKDSLTTESTLKQLNELQVKYDINTLNNEKTMLKMKNKQNQLVSLSILLVILVSTSTYFYFSWKKEKKMKQELKLLHNKAQESEKMKQEFINSICHEIRTPLNAIVGFSDLIMNEDIDMEMRQEFPAEIQKNTAALTGLINSMLEVANLDVSEEKLPCESTDLRNICIEEMEQIVKKPTIEYNLEITEDSMYIMTNAPYLTQVIGHLLSNANKFTEKGSITLGYQMNELHKEIVIYVTDTGCGIPLEKHEEVFTRFSKLDTFVPGNGLGLYLCLLIVRRLSGEIKIDPEYTNGTRMVVTLPTK